MGIFYSTEVCFDPFHFLSGLYRWETKHANIYYYPFLIFCLDSRGSFSRGLIPNCSGIFNTHGQQHTGLTHFSSSNKALDVQSGRCFSTRREDNSVALSQEGTLAPQLRDTSQQLSGREPFGHFVSLANSPVIGFLADKLVDSSLTPRLVRLEAVEQSRHGQHHSCTGQ